MSRQVGSMLHENPKGMHGAGDVPPSAQRAAGSARLPGSASEPLCRNRLHRVRISAIQTVDWESLRNSLN